MVDITDAYSTPEFLTYNVNEYTLNKKIPTLSKNDNIFQVSGDLRPAGNVISLKGQTNDFIEGDIFSMRDDLTSKQFRVKSVIKTELNTQLYTNLEYTGLTSDSDTAEGIIGKKIFKISRTQSATAEVPINDSLNNYDASTYEKAEHTVENYNTFSDLKNSLPFTNNTAKLKFFARTPGTEGNSIEVAIAKPEDFNQNKVIKEGIPLDGQFDYLPYGNQFAVIVLFNNEIKESFIVSFDETEKNEKNEFIYIENQINDYSNYILVNVNEGLSNTIKTCLNEDIIKLSNGSYSPAGEDDIIDGYSTFENKEELDVDLVIANEVYPQAAINLAITRADCIAFVGAPRSASVGLKNSIANTKTIDFRKSLNVDSRYITLNSNYKYQYSSELGKNIWVNLAGDIAGLKAQSNFNNYTWYAAAGLNRGNVKNVVKLAYSPAQAERDNLYKNGINPVVIFPNTGAVLWGQKTLQTKASSFDRVNVVALFNYLERSLGRMSKNLLFEFNDEFQRNYFLSLVRPFLAQVKSGRGISDFLVICDESNNTPQVVANNQFVADIYIKPNYSAEFIYLRFTNVGTNDFSIITGTA